MQLKKIKVYGKLRQFLGKSYFEAAVRSPQQAMSFLMANFEGLQKHMNDQIYKIKMGGNVITEDYLSMSGEGDIQIIPIATGSAFLVPILIGGGAVAAASTVGAFVGGIVGSALVTTAITTALTTIGTSMIIGGVTDLIAPQNTPQNISSVSETDPRMRGSYSFSGIQNVSSSGVPVPIIYGLVFSGSILISSGTDTAQIKKSIS
jgi:predicted phage tail protein